VHLEPSSLDGELDPCSVLLRRSATEKERQIDQLYEDAPILHWLNGVRVLEELARGAQGLRVASSRRTSCCRFVLLVHATHDDLERIIGQGTLQGFRLLPRRAQPDIALFVGREDDRHRLAVDRRDNSLGLGRQKRET
jgi:hypothetical protein